MFRSETNLVLVRFEMTPKKGQPGNLLPEDIELREDGVPQKIAVFQGGESNPQTVPVEVNLLFAWGMGSGRTRGKVLDLSSIDDHERVSVAIWTVGVDLVQLTPPTRDAIRLGKAMDGLQEVRATSTDRAPLFGAIGALASAAARGRTNVIRTLVVITGGVSAYDKNGIPEALRAVQDASITVFPVLVRNVARDSVPAIGYSAPELVDEFLSFGKKTNGRPLTIDYVISDAWFDQVFKWLGEQIRYGYVAGFYPESSDERKPHKVQVTLKDAKRGELAGDVQTITH